MMMRLWAESYSRSTPVSSSAILSVTTHVLLIAVAVMATRRPQGMQSDWLENRPYFLLPPNRVPAQQGSRETIKYVELAPEGMGAGFGGPAIQPEKKAAPETSETVGDLGRDQTNSNTTPQVTSEDTVFSVLEVDSSVTRYPGSAAPAYPLAMLRQGVQGSVTTQYVVDTSGFADTVSLRIIRSSNPEFSAAVRSALPYMRFFPAKVGTKHVRQLVEQEFTFKIEQSATQAADVKKPESDKPSPGKPNPNG